MILASGKGAPAKHLLGIVMFVRLPTGRACFSIRPDMGSFSSLPALVSSQAQFPNYRGPETIPGPQLFTMKQYWCAHTG